MGYCSICLEELEELAFTCPTAKCEYELCSPCVRLAFEDASGDNARACPSCKTPTARYMMESLCGPGAVREVEREVRHRVEFEVRKEKKSIAAEKAELQGMQERALKYMHKLVEQVNMRCPRCLAVFDDYDGCNALSCRCGAKFCAICLKDCGADAHPHATSHGDLFDKTLFEQAKRTRERSQIDSFIEGIENEPFEVKELIRIECEKTFSHGKSNTAQWSGAGIAFLRTAKANLQSAIKKDRMSVLSDGLEGVVTGNDITPRCAVPDDYRLRLTSDGSSICRISLQKRRGLQWVPVSLPRAGEPMKDHDGPEVDALFNLEQSLRCAVVAFEGERRLYQTRSVKPPKGGRLEQDEISVVFTDLSPDGALGSSCRSLSEIGCDHRTILGLNPTQRLMLLDRHVAETADSELLFEPLKHYVGMGSPKRLFSHISLPPSKTFDLLNAEQQKVAHPFSMLSAMEAAGPPGTGKSRTITELVRAVLRCTDRDVILMSERNGAVDAVAEKLAGDSIKQDGTRKVVCDVKLWMSILAFGSSGMGPSTGLFTIDQKLQYHPELMELKSVVQRRKKDRSILRGDMLSDLADAIESLDGRLPKGSEPLNRSKIIKSGVDYELSTPSQIVLSVQASTDTLSKLIESGTTLDETDLEDAVRRHSYLIGRLLPIRDDVEKDKHQWSTFRRRREFTEATKVVLNTLRSVLKTDRFSVGNATHIETALVEAEKTLQMAETRVNKELAEQARVMLCTIGSSHKLPVACDDVVESDLVESMGRLTVSDAKPTIIVFDEAGCIPSYELLGLSRLGRSIEGLVCVGDKHQLPPYDPGASSQRSKSSFGRYEYQRPTTVVTDKVHSLLDASAMSVEDGTKHLLTTQYRVPHDIANLLNAHIYKGLYHTAPECRAPVSGFRLVHVTESRHGNRKKYINKDEIESSLDLVLLSIQEGYDRGSIMVLTPYKKQQRQLQYRFKDEFLAEINVLTIDQCQGQEADIVILSLVQKPTRFLNKNRFNVALSRVRQRLYLVTDTRQFREASRDRRWECCHLAADLLALAGDE